MSFIKRLDLLSRLREGSAKKVAMDIFGYTPEEFKTIDKESSIMRQAKREGKIIYEAK